MEQILEELKEITIPAFLIEEWFSEIICLISALVRFLFIF